MGGDFEIMTDNNGKFQLLFIDKGDKKINVGSKLSDFTIKKKLGEGNFGAVYLVHSNITKKLYAMKEIKPNRYKSESQRSNIEKEIKLLENLHHPHVITYFTSFRENDNNYIVTEYINGGSLEDLLKKNIAKNKLFNERTIWDYLVQSLSGLLYLHNVKKIIHRDLKPDNILIDYDGHLKISDFGVSAIKSEEVEDLIKCHDTIAGPIQFMSPEMALGGSYDFKSDIYMLGLTFFIMMSNTLPEKKITLGPLIIPVRNKDAKLPESYSDILRKFILKLLNPPDERPSTREAYFEAISLYSVLFLKITSFSSSLQCFLSIPSINSYFKSEKIQTYIDSDYNKDNKDKQYYFTKIVKEALFHLDQKNFNYELAKIECLKLRILLYLKKEDINRNTEINPSYFVSDLLSELHYELNKYKNPGNNPNNNEHNENRENIDMTNEKEVILNAITKFKEKCRSKISDQFYHLTKTMHECPECNNIIRYSTTIKNGCSLYPERAVIYLNKKDLNIIDLFKHYKKKRLFEDENIPCKFCGKTQKNVNRIKSFYTSPLQLILEINYEDEQKFNLTINEYIDLGEFIELKDISKCNYHLVGAIFIEQNEKEKKYISITKNENKDWVYFNGKNFENSSFNELANHKKLRMLFYSSS